MNFLISAAGTGGHVFPALEFSKECISKDHKVVWIGTKFGIENQIMPSNIKFLNIPMSGFRGKSLVLKFNAIFRLIQSVCKSIYFLQKNEIDYVVCFGGYVTLPVGISAWVCRKPLFLHEQNSVLGTSNRLLKIFAKNVFLGFAINEPMEKKMILVGNPIKKFAGDDSLNSNHQSLKIYITGGSQGSEYINHNIPKALNDLEIPLKVKHQTGIGKTHGILDLYSNKIDAEIVEFYDSPQDSMLWSDFIISRAGALSLSEAISLNRGLLMIPLLISIDNHQFLNAQNIVKQGMGLLHEETESFEQLSNKLKEIIDQELHLKWSKKNNNTYHFSAAEKMLSSILKLEKK